MFPQRTILRATQRFAPQIRSVRQPLQRRLNSTQEVVEDNAFNRERAAVKKHASETSGKSHLYYKASIEEYVTNSFNLDLWRKLSI
jgi:hypothetical protein